MLWLDGEKLRYRSPGELHEPLLSTLKEHKEQIVQLFSCQDGRFLVRGYICDCGNDLYIPKAYSWVDIDDTPCPGYQCVSCGTRY